MANRFEDKCRLPSALWRALSNSGLHTPAILRLAGLPQNLLRKSDAWLKTDDYFRLWHVIESQLPDQGLGISLVRSTYPSSHPPSSLSAFFAQSFKDGLHRLRRYKQLCTPEEIHVKEIPGARIFTHSWPFATRLEPPILVDITFASILEIGRVGTGKSIRPLKVELSRSAPVSTVYQEYFECGVQFNAAANAIWLSLQDLELPFPGHNPELQVVLGAALDARLPPTAPISVCAEVKEILKDLLPSGRPGLSEVARRLGVSERTLQRRLSEENRTLRDLIAEARTSMARDLLADPRVSNDEIAFLLGFQDTTSFFRAFREAAGATPSQWRTMTAKNETD